MYANEQIVAVCHKGVYPVFNTVLFLTANSINSNINMHELLQS